MTTVLVLIAVWLVVAALLLVGWHRLMSAADRSSARPPLGQVPRPRAGNGGSVSPAGRPERVPPRA